MTNQTYNEESRGVAMNIFAVLGFIAILIAGLWATVQLVKQISNISFDFSKPTINIPTFGNEEKLTLVKNTNTLKSGESAKIAWELSEEAQKDENSTLSFSYGCKSGVYIKVFETESKNYRAIPCNAPYVLPSVTTTEMSIMPVLTSVSSADISYALTYASKTKDGETVVKNSTMTVVRGTSPITSPVMKREKTITKNEYEPIKEGAYVRTTSPSVTPVPAKKITKTTLVPVRKSDPNGTPDLTVKILEIQTIGNTDKVSVKFEVANIGTKLVNSWTFTAVLPTDPAYTYVSEAQGALYAGERAEMLMTFDKLKSGNNSIVITVDAQNAIKESLETNNSVERNIFGK